MKIRLLILSFVVLHSLGMFCNYYPLDEKACVEKTEGIACRLELFLGQFNFFQNACLETESTSLGCSPNLNKIACLQQLSYSDGTEARCNLHFNLGYFGKKCGKANNSHLKHLNCDNNFSQFACVNVKSQKCQWISNTCVASNEVPQTVDFCKNAYMTSVSPWLCAQIPELKCYNNGYEGGYQCIDVDEKQLSTLTCDVLGLSQMACVSITTSNQKCLFLDNHCQTYVSQQILNCSDSLNKALCLSITDPSLACQWSKTGCVEINNQNCEQLTLVNPSACRKASGLCHYDDDLKKCKLSQADSCNTPGLNEESCLSIKNEKCIYSKDQCRVISDEELQFLSCDQKFSEAACTSLLTPFQYCIWDGKQCSRLIINQDTECPLKQEGLFNGNTCKAISKYMQGCKYNEESKQCQANQPNSDTCSTSFLNLHGCISVLSNVACQWNTEKMRCEEVKVVEQLTKCEDLEFANAKACSQIIEPITIQNKQRIVPGCFNNGLGQCMKMTKTDFETLNCTQPGLNKYGCTQIQTLGQRCRWVRGTCTQIIKKESLARVNCLELSFSNPGTCALVEANKEVCKYKSEALGCVNVLDQKVDKCDTLGLNQYACAKIDDKETGCYFDKINNICVNGPNTSSIDEVEVKKSSLLLSSAKCVESSPTLNICIAITTQGELCSWDSRLERCEYQNVQFNQKCLDFNQAEKQKSVPSAKVNVNANVCASIPDRDPVTGDDVLRGYCEFDGLGNCIIYSKTPCSDDCCTTKAGINAHVCSRYTNRNVYCYFNNYNKCVQLTNDDTDITSDEQVKAYYNYKKYQCSSMNYKSCAMIEWSPKQKCYWNGNVCTQIIYEDYKKSDFLIFSAARISKYACLGIEASKTNVNKYFKYTSTCFFDAGVLTTCNELVNINSCLGKSDNLYCQWNKIELQCTYIDDYLDLKTCYQYQNKKACINNPYVPCLFIDSLDRCMSSPQEVNCDEFDNTKSDYHGWVNTKACANITKAGQICKFNGVAGCTAVKDSSSSCDLPGINSIGCYGNTTGNCRWDSTKLECYEIDIATLSSLKCTDNVNKTICLTIPYYACEWSNTDMKCKNKSQFITIGSTLLNAQACTQMIGDAYYYDQSTSTCNTHDPVTDKNNCTAYIMNKQACLMNTKGFRCYFDSNQLPENKCQTFQQEQDICTSNIEINLDICMNIPKACYFDSNEIACKTAKLNSSTKCSSLISDIYHYNKLACSSISTTITDKNITSKSCDDSSAEICQFENYCYWNDYGCQMYQIVSLNVSEDNKCSAPQNNIPACDSIYSEAVCLQFGKMDSNNKNTCYFDITQGGCKSYASNTYKVTDCAQINGDQCSLSKIPAAYCKQQSATPDDLKAMTPDCTIKPTTTSICVNDTSFVKKTCAQLSSEVTATVCAQASDDCYLNTNCITPKSEDTIKCTTSGVSQSLCLSLTPPCDFTQGQCTPLTIPTLGSDNQYFVCNEANILITKKQDLACASITSSPCKYQNKTCQNAYFQTCTSLSGLIVSQLACNQCLNEKACYDPLTMQCQVIETLPKDCDTIADATSCSSVSCQWDDEIKKCHINTLRLNKLSCLQLTNDILAKWENNNCVILTSTSAKSETDCTIQSIKSCTLANNACQISGSPKQCEKSSLINQSCGEIDKNQSKCLASSQQACKFSGNTCKQASLDSDQCQDLNKFGCINKSNDSCGWSDKDTKCKQIDFKTNSNSCTKYADGNDKNYNQVNPNSCSKLVNGKCYWNSTTNQCASVGNTKISCTTNVGINQAACIQSTVGKCKFDTLSSSCVEITSSDTKCSSLTNQDLCRSFKACYFANNSCSEITCNSLKDEKACLSLNTCKFAKDSCSDTKCSRLLNQEACLSLDACIFSNNLCSDFTVATTFDDAKAIPAGVISPQICTTYNNSITNAYLIYDQTRGYCVNADKDNPSLYIAQCSSIGINSKICLQKTNEYCQYNNGQCSKITLNDITTQTTCNNTYNWFACIKLTQNCKFATGQCKPLSSDDKCFDLSSVIVSPSICAQMSDACQYNETTYGCEDITENSLNYQCLAVGISKKGCLEKTGTSYCYFDVNSNSCSDNYDRSLTCSDSTNKTIKWYINENLCYFIKSLGSYCYFDNGQCKQLGDSLVKSCYATSKTNSITCSKANSDILCFYNTSTKKCSQVEIDYKKQQWDNSSSFNKKACVSFDSQTDPRKVIWDEIKGCIELSTVDLANIQCSSAVNKLGCVSITNPTQFCQFKNQKCIGVDYTVPPSSPIGLCATLTNVNRQEFCQYASDSCKFNGATQSCVASTTENTNIYTGTDCSTKGLSKTACSNFSSSCKFSDERQLCVKNQSFCASQSLSACKTVEGEPCWIIDNSCQSVSNKDLQTTDCKVVANQVGCTSITNPSIVCQYDQINSECNKIDKFINACSTYTNVNSGKACEQTTDKACKFDYASKSCKTVSASDVFECDRGLNYIACTTYTRPSLQCQFGKFCFGPTFGVTKCSDMQNAQTCLNYNYQCQWINICINYVSTGQTCQQLQATQTVVSSQVCYNSQADQGACIYNTDTNTCKYITVKYCEQLETKQQCIQSKDLPCLWVNGQCTFYTLLSTDLCSTIGQNGTQRACMDVYRQGEFCQYSVNKCQAFTELIDGSSNCLDSLNIISCVQQQGSLCHWKVTTNQVWIDSITQNSYNSGVCMAYQPDPYQDCDSTLSYLSCFSITKKGQFCRWQNGQCLNIVLTQANSKIYYNTYQLINSNACGLVNVGKVRYSQETKSCIQIVNESLTCKCGQETKGLNKYACLSIKNENCQWNDTYKVCSEHDTPCSTNRLLTTNECFKLNAQPEDCQKLNVQYNCGYLNGNCIEIDLTNVTCITPGLNRNSCENIKYCNWVNEQCQEQGFNSEAKILILMILIILIM